MIFRYLRADVLSQVYQANVYGDACKFVSFRRVVTEMSSKVLIPSLPL
jgi:hypothetical protein